LLLLLLEPVLIKRLVRLVVVLALSLVVDGVIMGHLVERWSTSLVSQIFLLLVLVVGLWGIEVMLILIYLALLGRTSEKI
jgi:hypothetical protein